MINTWNKNPMITIGITIINQKGINMISKKILILDHQYLSLSH